MNKEKCPNCNKAAWIKTQTTFEGEHRWCRGCEHKWWQPVARPGQTRRLSAEDEVALLHANLCL